MERRFDINPAPRTSISAEQAEELFAKVDNSGHTNAKKAERQRKRRKEFGHGVEVDPLSTDDPSGSNVGKVITRASVFLIVGLLAVIVFVQVYSSQALRKNTAILSNDITVQTVADALSNGIEWGNGFTQFPEDFSVQEADQNTGRIEVTVVDTSSSNALVCFSNAQIQAAALSVSSLLNPQIDTVIYHVNVHTNEDGTMQQSSMFDFFKPTGDLKPFMTFIWTKNTTPDGQVRFNCTITGVDSELQETLRSQILTVAPEATSKKDDASSSADATTADDLDSRRR